MDKKIDVGYRGEEQGNEIVPFLGKEWLLSYNILMSALVLIYRYLIWHGFKDSFSNVIIMTLWL